jgi:NAD+ diphosphatase
MVTTKLPPLDRRHERRDDAAFLALAAARADALVVPVHGLRVLVADGAPRALVLARAAALPQGGAELIWLGELNGAPCFAVEVADPLVVQGGLWSELRPVLPLLSQADLDLLAYARALIYWTRTHRHCGACGAATEPWRGGHERRCPSCTLVAFPRIDPAVIVAVADARRILLGRQAAWDPGRYSVLAGFVEPGESLEAAAAREVREETGVEIAAPRYFASQPWPFPASMMIGFHATPTRDAIHLDGQELEAARWFTRADIVAGLAGGQLSLSPHRSIAWQLIESWFDREGARLASVPGA